MSVPAVRLERDAVRESIRKEVQSLLAGGSDMSERTSLTAKDVLVRLSRYDRDPSYARLLEKTLTRRQAAQREMQNLRRLKEMRDGSEEEKARMREKEAHLRQLIQAMDTQIRRLRAELGPEKSRDRSEEDNE